MSGRFRDGRAAACHAPRIKEASGKRIRTMSSPFPIPRAAAAASTANTAADEAAAAAAAEAAAAKAAADTASFNARMVSSICAEMDRDSARRRERELEKKKNNGRTGWYGRF